MYNGKNSEHSLPDFSLLLPIHCPIEDYQMVKNLSFSKILFCHTEKLTVKYFLRMNKVDFSHFKVDKHFMRHQGVAEGPTV